MPLDAPRADPRAAIVDAVADLGHAIRALLPRKAAARDVLASAYWGWSLVATEADAWRKQAKAEATAGGVLPDYAAKPFPVGASETVYTGPLLAIGLRVTPQGDRIDIDGVVAFLTKAGVKPELLARALKANTRSFPGAHVFTASLR